MTQVNQIWHEPESFQQFQCINESCTDLCCEGWAVGVDRPTFERYQTLDHQLAPRLQQLVNISPAGQQGAYASIQLENASCPFLAEKLCSVHAQLGEDYLGQACATFPRVVNAVEGAVERSLDLACPEAARIVLLNPAPDFFAEFSGITGPLDGRLVEVAQSRPQRAVPLYFEEIRSSVIGILQDRHYDVSRRLLLVGHLCTKLQELQDEGRQDETIQVLDGFSMAIQGRLFDEHLNQTSADPSTQLSIVLALTVGRISLDYTTQRYRDLYNEFTAGLGLKSDSVMSELGRNYADAYFQYYAPLVEQREYILEHYLVSYAYKNLFPFGSGSIVEQYLFMASLFAMTRSLAIGLAGYHRSSFEVAHVVRAIQVSSRALEHCTTYPARVFEILAAHGIRVPAAMAVLTQGLAEPAFIQSRYAVRKMKAVA